jgi:hypothetical protein
MMASTRESRNLSISINRAAGQAYDFLCAPENFPKWASGLAGSLRQAGGGWIAQTPDGPVRIRFSERNAFGVLDHWVYPQPGVEIYIPMRVVSNASGCELLFTLFRLPGMSDEKFSADAEWVMRDLAAAKLVLESQ